MSEHLGDRFVSAPSPDHLTRTLTSRDGTVIGYRQLGSGPGFVVVGADVEIGAGTTIDRGSSQPQ